MLARVPLSFTLGLDPGGIDQQVERSRSALLQRRVVRRPVPGLVLRRGPTAHARQLSRWIHTGNPSPNLCNKATPCPNSASSRPGSPTGTSDGNGELDWAQLRSLKTTAIQKPIPLKMNSSFGSIAGPPRSAVQ